MSLDWKLKDVLAQHNITVYRLADVSGVPRNTLYNLVNKEPARVDLGTLNAVLGALDELTGERVEVSDLLERSTQAASTKKKSWRDFAGTFDDPDSPGDVAINHDKYLGEALMEEHLEGLAGKR